MISPRRHSYQVIELGTEVDAGFMGSEIIHLGGLSLRKRVPRAPGWLSSLSIQLLISAQVMISWFVTFSLELGSELKVRNLLRVLSLSVSLSLSLYLPLSALPGMLSLSCSPSVVHTRSLKKSE